MTAGFRRSQCPPTLLSSLRRSPAGSQGPVIVEVDHPDTSPDGRPAERVWVVVTLRRGQRSVVLANDLGWPSAHALAGQLEDLLHRPVPHEGGAIG
jgi:hypothetical protein